MPILLAVVWVLVVDDQTLATEMLSGDMVKLLISFTVVPITCFSVALLSQSEDKETLREFYKKIQPGGSGWKKVVNDAKKEGVLLEPEGGVNWQMPLQILLVFIGCLVIYSCLFSIGSFVYGNFLKGFILLTVVAVGSYIMFRLVSKLNFR